MKIAKEVRVGVLAIVAIAMLIVGYQYLRGEDVFSSMNHYYAEYDKVDNLFKSNPVLLNGYKIGQVSNVTMDHQTLKLTVEIAIPSTIKVPIDSKIKIINSDMIGSKGVEIVFGNSDDIARDGTLLESEKEENIISSVGQVATDLSIQLSRILGKVDTAVTDVDLSTTLIAANAAFLAFKETADQLNAMLDGKEEDLDVIFANIEMVSADLRKLSPQIDSIAYNLKKTSDDIAGIDWQGTVAQINSLSEELTKISQSLNNAEGSMGKLLNEDTMYVNLNNTITQLESLLADIEANPCRYFSLTDRQRRKCEEEIEKNKN